MPGNIAKAFLILAVAAFLIGLGGWASEETEGNGVVLPGFGVMDDLIDSELVPALRVYVEWACQDTCVEFW